MIVYHWTWLIKNNRLGEAAGSAKEGCQSFWKAEKYVTRIYSSDLGPGNNLVIEAEGEDEAHFTEVWKHLDKWSGEPYGTDWWKRFNDTVERFISTERWNLVR